MASFNLTVEDGSPLLSYSPPGAWSDSPSNDTFLSSYSGSSYHTTSVQGATATVTFNGTGITFLGGHRPNYGTYIISVDGRTIANESSAGQDIFKQVLGSAYGLSNGKHTAVLMSSSASPIDIDVVDIQTEIGESGSQLAQFMVDDSNSSFIYSPLSEWHVNEKDYFINNTLHYTSTAGASAAVTFSGEAIALYGTVSQDHANIVLSLDGKNFTFGAGATPSTAVSTLHPEILLYYAQDLGSGQHSLIVSADPQSATGPFIDVDAIVVYSTSGSNSQSSTSSTPSSQPDATFSGKLSKSTVIGVVVGTVLGVLILSIIVTLLLRWRYQRLEKREATPAKNPSVLEAGNQGLTLPRPISQNSNSSFYSGPQPPEGYVINSPTASIESFSSSAPINARNAVPISLTRGD